MATKIPLRQLPSGQWQARARRRGYPELSYTSLRREDAEGWWLKITSEQQRGVWRDSSEAERTTLREALDRYEREVTPRKGSQKSERSTLKTLRASRIADLALARIGSHHVAGLRDDWRDDLAAATIKRRMTVLKHVFTIARQEWGMPGLTWPGVKLDPEDNATERRVGQDEIEALCADTESAELPSIVRLLVETACRRSELVRNLRANIDLEKRRLFIPKHLAKNGHARTVPLSSLAIEIFRALPAREDGRLFSMQPDSVTQAFERAARRAGIADVRIHDLRHEATSRLALKYGLLDLAKITGHTDPKMLMRYYHPGDEYLADKMD